MSEVRINLQPEWWEMLLARAEMGTHAYSCLQLAAEDKDDFVGPKMEYRVACDRQTAGALYRLASVVCRDAAPAIEEALRRSYDPSVSRRLS